MSIHNAAKGSRFEVAVRDYLNETTGRYRENWRECDTPFRNPVDRFNVRRPNQERQHDVGDIHAWPFVLQCKDVAKPSTPKWIGAAGRQARFAGFPFSVAVHKTRRANVRQSRVAMTVRQWTRLRMILGAESREAAYAYGAAFAVRGIDTAKWYVSLTLDDFARLLRDVRIAGQF
ncbi:hypothetical protein [Streptomyces lycii]|uniref:Uncharacterized protein n=1 Tax=Streptomyces lycii TaxID=2654337 RepID=A0ABQ7FIH0_9ACTN|nr:hypothetical protein [Streptomyces lycii]KAF4408630.1 hypothetical protein GCU69_13100 [Streptomyces lycii]